LDSIHTSTCFVSRDARDFYGEGMFRVAPRFTTKTLEEILRHNCFKMLLSKGKITEDLADMLINPARGED